MEILLSVLLSLCISRFQKKKKNVHFSKPNSLLFTFFFIIQFFYIFFSMYIYICAQLLENLHVFARYLFLDCVSHKVSVNHNFFLLFFDEICLFFAIYVIFSVLQVLFGSFLHLTSTAVLVNNFFFFNLFIQFLTCQTILKFFPLHMGIYSYINSDSFYPLIVVES